MFFADGEMHRYHRFTRYKENRKGHTKLREDIINCSRVRKQDETKEEGMTLIHQSYKNPFSAWVTITMDKCELENFNECVKNWKIM